MQAMVQPGSPSPAAADTFTLSIASSLAGLFVVAVAVVATVWYRKHKRHALNLFNIRQADEFELERHDIRIHKLLGQGRYGQVRVGFVAGIEGNRNRALKVAVKTCKLEEGFNLRTHNRAKQSFYHEMELVKLLSCPPQRNVLRMLGQVTQSEPMVLVLEYMARGDLRSVLLHHRATEDAPPGLSTDRLVQFCADVARGMSFLESHFIVHRGEYSSGLCF